jgi:hypothetical protein
MWKPDLHVTQHQQINWLPDFHAIECITSLQNLTAQNQFVQCVRCPTSVKNVYILVTYTSNGFVFICGANTFTAITAAPAGSAVLSAGSLVARPTDTWAVGHVRSQHPNTACSSKQTQWNVILFQLEIFCNDSSTFHWLVNACHFTCMSPVTYAAAGVMIQNLRL